MSNHVVITALETLHQTIDQFETTLTQFQTTKHGQQADLFSQIERARDQNQQLKKDLDLAISQLEAVLNHA
jgi:hypothetical protein